MTTPFQKEANARNAQLSTGPQTVEGKARSRMNALGSGLAGAGIVLPETQQAAIVDMTATLTERYQPADADAIWWVKQLATAQVRIEACQAEQSLHASRLAAEAALLWDTNCRLEAVECARHLERDPEATVLRLQQSAQGCDLLIGRLELMARAGEERGTWTLAEKDRALDLFGVPHAVRSLPTVLDPTLDDSPEGYMYFALCNEIERLKQMRANGLDALDGLRREAAELGLVAADRHRKNLKSYEQAHWRQLRTARHQLEQRPDAPARPAPLPEPAPVSAAPAQPEPSVPAEVAPREESAPNADLVESTISVSAPVREDVRNGFATVAAHDHENGARDKRRKARKAARQQRRRSRR